MNPRNVLYVALAGALVLAGAPVAKAADVDPVTFGACTPGVGVLLVGACAGTYCDPEAQVADPGTLHCRVTPGTWGSIMCPIRLGFVICLF